MKTYKEHYESCRSSFGRILGPWSYDSAYELGVDDNFLDDRIDQTSDPESEWPEYYSLIKDIRSAIDKKIKDQKGIFYDDHAIRINDWQDIQELEQLAQFFMPVVEHEILGCYGKIEFLHPYRNIIHENQETSSWTWHYDDCPDEFLKLFINLNEVTEDSGPLKYLELHDGSASRIKTYNTVAGIRGTQPPLYPGSRIPQEVVDKEIERGGKIKSITGKPGSYAICTPNIIHKASVPKVGTEPRDVLFFFIRPTLKPCEQYLKDTWSYRPAKNVKMYNLD